MQTILNDITTFLQLQDVSTLGVFALCVIALVLLFGGKK